MHYRRVACWLLGAWFLGSLIVYRVTSTYSDATESVLNASVPEIHRIAIGRSLPIARGLLEYMAADRDRVYFREWEWTQVLLGVGVAYCLWMDRQKRSLVVLAGAAIVLVAFQHHWVTPEIVYLREAQSFPAKGPPPSDFHDSLMERLYIGIEIAKLLLLLGATVVLFRMQGMRSRVRVRRETESLPD